VTASLPSRWIEGETKGRAELEGAVARLARDEDVEWLRRRDRRRRLARVALPGGSAVFAKIYLAADRHPLREWWKRRLGLTTAEREWRTLKRLRSAGLSVPAPLAHLQLATGEHVVVTEWLEGRPLGEALPASPRSRRSLLTAVGALVRRLHGAGWVHRDLHGENVLVAGVAPVLVDLQAAARRIGERARMRDLGSLDHSLRARLSLGDRVRLRAAALGLTRPFDRTARAQLRAVGRAALARGRAHATSRARRSLRAGRRARPFAVEGGRGLIARDADEARVRAALEGAQTPGVEVRRYPRTAPLRRRSTAARAWAVAHALEASDVAVVKPLAFLEWRRLGLPGRSLLVVESSSLAERCTAERAARARSALRARLREAGFATGALPDPGIACVEREGALAAQVVALEALRLPARTIRPGDQRPVVLGLSWPGS